MIMGSWVRIRIFDIFHFVRDLLFPLLKISKSGSHMVHVPNFWGCQVRRTGVGTTTVCKSLTLGGEVTRVL